MQQTNSIKKNRVPYLDTLRVIACLMVVFTHSTMPANDSDGIYLAFISFISSPSSELFLTLSGAILLPVKVDLSSFYKKRFSKLIPPLLIWSAVYTLLLFFEGKIDFNIVIERLVKMPFTPIVGVYWFIYVMIGLYLFAPFISPWIKNATKKHIEIFLLIWSISLFMPFLNILIPGIYNNGGSYYWSLINFSGFIGYWILGYYLRTYPITIGLNTRWLSCLVGIVIYLIVLAILKYNNFAMQPFFDNLQIGSALFVTIIFTSIQHLVKRANKKTNIISSFATCSFGIYLIHIIIIRHIVWYFFETSNLNPILETFIITIISFNISFIIVKCLSKLPFSKFIIGI